MGIPIIGGVVRTVFSLPLIGKSLEGLAKKFVQSIVGSLFKQAVAAKQLKNFGVAAGLTLAGAVPDKYEDLAAEFFEGVAEGLEKAH